MRESREAAYYANDAARQVAVVAHVAAHELGVAAYAIRAAQAAALESEREEAARSEREWQRAGLPAQLRELVLDDQRATTRADSRSTA